MLVSELLDSLNNFFPPALKETYDNVGLLVGNPSQKISGVLVSLDVTEAVLDEAIAENYNVIVSHHPVIFSGLKSITGKNYTERIVIKALKNDVALVAIHTNLDNMLLGVNQKICEKIGLENTQILLPKQGILQKLVAFVPETHAEVLKNALFAAGAGEMGDYTNASFSSVGIGSFLPNVGAKPFLGEVGRLQQVAETRVEVVFEQYKEKRVLKAFFETHPYQTPAYDLIQLTNTVAHIGSGMVGSLPQPMPEVAFLEHIKKQFGVKMVRHTALSNQKISKVAVCGGSGSTLLTNAIAAKADVYISADFKYHQFFDADSKILIADIGHYETEQFTCEIINDFLSKKMSNFAPTKITKINTNPIYYT